MIVKDTNGLVLIDTDHKTLRATLEYCAVEGVDLSDAVLRKARLSGASLDGLKARGADFWGADLCGSDLGLADLRGCDFRCTDLTDACLAESDLRGTNLEGAYFRGTILDGADFSAARLSCPSFWSCALYPVKSLAGAVYIHKGEEEIVLSCAPVVVNNLERLLVIGSDFILWGEDKSAVPSLYDVLHMARVVALDENYGTRVPKNLCR